LIIWKGRTASGITGSYIIILLTIQNFYNKKKFGLKDYSLTIEKGIPGPNGAGVFIVSFVICPRYD